MPSRDLLDAVGVGQRVSGSRRIGGSWLCTVQTFGAAVDAMTQLQVLSAAAAWKSGVSVVNGSGLLVCRIGYLSMSVDTSESATQAAQHLVHQKAFGPCLQCRAVCKGGDHTTANQAPCYATESCYSSSPPHLPSSCAWRSGPRRVLNSLDSVTCIPAVMAAVSRTA